MDVSFFLFFFAKKSRFQGMYNNLLKLKNEMTLILEFFFAKKKKSKLARWALASAVQSISLTRFSSPG